MNRAIGLTSALTVAAAVGSFALSMVLGSENASYMALSTLFVGLTISAATATGRWLRYMLLTHGVFAPICLALPIIDVFSAMPRASGAAIGVAISFGWCAYFLPVALLAFAYLRSLPLSCSTRNEGSWGQNV